MFHEDLPHVQAEGLHFGAQSSTDRWSVERACERERQKKEMRQQQNGSREQPERKRGRERGPVHMKESPQEKHRRGAGFLERKTRPLWLLVPGCGRSGQQKRAAEAGRAQSGNIRSYKYKGRESERASEREGLR